MDYSEKSKRQRRYLQSYFANSRLPDYYALQLNEAHRLLNDLLRDPSGYKTHIHRMMGGITMMMTYGHPVDSISDKFIAIAERGVATIRAAGTVGAHPVDLVPWRQLSIHDPLPKKLTFIQCDLFLIGCLAEGSRVSRQAPVRTCKIFSIYHFLRSSARW
jgi:hypothetical protein